MSSNPLFDEDSSDEEEQANLETTEPVSTAEPQTKEEDDGEKKVEGDVGVKQEEAKPASSTAAIFGDDSDDDDEDVGGTEAMDVEKGTAEGEDTPKKKPTTNDLFGDDSDDDDDEEAKLDDVVGSAAPASSKKKTGDEKMEGEDGYQDGRASAGITRAPQPPAKATVLESERPESDVTLHMTKLPNLVAIQPAAFEEKNYFEKDEEEQFKGYVHNMIRWRYKRDENQQFVRDENGKLQRESNTRLVKWSDGSFTMHVGKEAFDIQTVDSSQANGFAGLNGYVYLSQKATYEDEDANPGGTVLECMGPVASRLVAKPSSLQSEAHKSLTVAVRQKTIKKARIAEYVTQEDPELAKEARIRNREDLERATAHRNKSSYRPYSSGGGSSSRHRQPGMNRRYLEDDDDDDYDTTNIRALKKGTADDDMNDYGDESDDDDDDEIFGKGRDRKRRKKAEEEEEEEEELVFDNDSDDEGTLITARKKSNRGHQAVVDDDDDD